MTPSVFGAEFLGEIETAASGGWIFPRRIQVPLDDVAGVQDFPVI